MNNKPLEIAKQVLQQEGESIIYLKDNIGEEFNKAVELILNRKGRLLIIGLGKSGHKDSASHQSHCSLHGSLK